MECCGYFFSNLFQILYSLVRSLVSSLEIEWWFKGRVMSIPDLEWGLSSTAVWTCIVDKLDNGKQFSLIVLLEVSTDMQVLLDFLVYSFRFSIGLWVEGSG